MFGVPVSSCLSPIDECEWNMDAPELLLDPRPRAAGTALSREAYGRRGQRARTERSSAWPPSPKSSMEFQGVPGVPVTV